MPVTTKKTEEEIPRETAPRHEIVSLWSHNLPTVRDLDFIVSMRRDTARSTPISGCGDWGRPPAFPSNDADRRVALGLVRRYERHQKMVRAIAVSVDLLDSGKDVGSAVGRIIV
jgi:hypothetical protein